MGAAVVGAIVRFVLGLIIALLTVSIIDKPNLPKWFLEILWLDGVNKSYLSLIYMYHLHNHPIHITFAYLLSKLFILFFHSTKCKILKLKIVYQQKLKKKRGNKIPDEEKTILEPEETHIQHEKSKIRQRIAKRLYLAYFLSKNRNLDLKKYRKHNLQNINNNQKSVNTESK